MQVTAMTGPVFEFDPTKVWMITGPHANDTDSRFYLYGVSGSPLAVAGDAAAFIATMDNKADYAELHFARTNKVFWVHAPSVSAIHGVGPQALVKFPFAEAAIFVGGERRFVTETVAAAKTALNAAGGSF